MSLHFILPERRSMPQLPEPHDIDFRLLGRLLSLKPWMPLLFGGRYSFADHLLNLAEIAPADFQLESLLLFAHSAFDEPVMPMIEEQTDSHRFSASIKPVGQGDPYITRIRASIRLAAGLERHPDVGTLRFLIAAQNATIQAELRDMGSGHASSVTRGAAITKHPIMPRTPESAAALWADRVEQHIPDRMAERNPERVAS
ncbi:hypothetical protein FDK21_19260 [Cohaesibacter sp. CAU 1516]|uniref:hypothetical protein n=1 Tax=Cohaesibacter sp. CAU 1516 TaxID=2576038 RepID=UPI0010FE1553|nr:hypothetical protein [Cohaesibacter sp. CAU 1516]TLP42653.1 hypothetical protein FDK21_19260 [Cohaesibacter sp. CAU 1516]